MRPYDYVKDATEGRKSLLSLCCGIGLELRDLHTVDVTAVDIVPEYIESLKAEQPHIKTICSDVLEYTKKQPDNSVDVISIIDGIEHLDKKSGLELIKEMKRVAREKILLFTPEGFVKNEPHHAWGIEAGDEHQTHKSGWSALELKDLGFQMLQSVGDISQHGEPYTAMMLEFTCSL